MVRSALWQTTFYQNIKSKNPLNISAKANIYICERRSGNLHDLSGESLKTSITSYDRKHWFDSAVCYTGRVFPPVDLISMRNSPETAVSR